MEAHEPSEQEMAQLIEVCGFLPNFLDKGTWRPVSPLQDLVFRTLVRGRGTFETIVDLVRADRTLQAAMLGRSLFEDMVVAHWLVLHDGDAQWLIERFEDHAAAMRVVEADTREQLGAPPTDDASGLRVRRAELRKRFGRYAEQDWWGQDREGQRLTMPKLVEKLAAAPEFRPRLRGEEPILEQYYALQQKAWTQALHHTAAGMEVQVGPEGKFPLPVARPSRFLILFGNYWVFGQLIFVSLELGAREATEYYEKLFLSGLAVFGEAIGETPSWADKVTEWAEELPPEQPSRSDNPSPPVRGARLLSRLRRSIRRVPRR